MPKRNIYFPDELVAKMSAFKDENWSGVCQEAVGARVRFLELKADSTTSAVDRAKARLATAKAAYIADARERGVRAGIEWAADHATFDQLRNLHAAQFGEHPTIDFPVPDGSDLCLLIARILAGWPSDALHDALADGTQDQESIDLAHDLWASLGLTDDSHDLDSGEFWEGFVTGAISVYEQV
jgi:hypothetical protein